MARGNVDRERPSVRTIGDLLDRDEDAALAHMGAHGRDGRDPREARELYGRALEAAARGRGARGGGAARVQDEARALDAYRRGG